MSHIQEMLKENKICIGSNQTETNHT